MYRVHKDSEEIGEGLQCFVRRQSPVNQLRDDIEKHHPLEIIILCE